MSDNQRMEQTKQDKTMNKNVEHLDPVYLQDPETNQTSFINFNLLKNPLLQRSDEDGPWAVKDFCVMERNGTFYVFFDAFYVDDDSLRSHIVEVKTNDFINFSEDLMHFDGRHMGWTGAASPNITFHYGTYYMVFNSWGKQPDENDLYYRTSKDLENWSEDVYPLAHNISENARLIDGAVAFQNNKVYLAYKYRHGQGSPMRNLLKIAVADDIDDNFSVLGDPTSGFHHSENGQFFRYNDSWYLLMMSVWYLDGNKYKRPVIYRMDGDGSKDYHWITWKDPFVIDPPHEAWGWLNLGEGAYMMNMENKDGYMYLFYAGKTTDEINGGRGDHKMSVARNKNMGPLGWKVPGAKE